MQVKSSKKFLINELKKLNIDYIDTYANFFHIKFEQKSRTLENIFKKKGILFRKGPGVKGFENYCRFSLGSITQIKKVLKVIKYVSR